MSFFRRGGAAALACLALWAETARAEGLVFDLPWLGPTAYTFTNTTQGIFRGNDYTAMPGSYDNNVLAIVEKFDSSLVAAPWRFQLRIDAFEPIFLPKGTLGSRGSPPPNCTETPGCFNVLAGDLRPEKVALRYQKGWLLAEAGDFYVVFGRGVGLSLRKVDPIGLDTTLRGANAAVEIADVVTFHPFAGYVNPQNLDPLTLATYHDWGGYLANNGQPLRPGPDLIGGGELVARLGPSEDVELAVDALRAHFPEDIALDHDVNVAGARISMPSLFDGALATHLEAHGLWRTESRYKLGAGNTRGPFESGLDTSGRAIYASVQANAGGLTTVLEWKDYRQFFLSPDGGSADTRRIYSSAPSLERDDVQFRNNSNTRGARLVVERAFLPGPWAGSITAVGSGFNEDEAKDPWASSGIGVAHGYFTIRRRPGVVPLGEPGPASSIAQVRGAPGIAGGARVGEGDYLVILSAGYRDEFLLGAHPEESRAAFAPDWRIVHGEADFGVPVGPADSLDLRVDGRYETRWAAFRVDPRTGMDIGPGDYSYFRGGMALTWSSGEQLNVSATLRYDSTNRSQGRTVLSDGVRSPFPVWYPAGEIRYMFLPGSMLRLFGGATPGGRLCTGGVCRDVPPFQGAVLELVLRL